MKKEIVEQLLLSKDKDVRQLAQEYQDIMASPYYDAYLTMRGQLMDWNTQLKIGEEQTINIGGVDHKIRKGQIDLFADKDTKEFERAFKYLDNIIDLADKLDKLKAKLSPEEAHKLELETSGSSYEKAREVALKSK